MGKTRIIVAKLLIYDYHERFMHQGQQTITNEIKFLHYGTKKFHRIVLENFLKVYDKATFLKWEVIRSI